MAVTPKLGLYLPVSTEIVDVRTAIHPQLNAIDAAMDAQRCHSTLRPGSPFTGMVIYEYNTQKIYYWNGTGWIFVAGNNGPGGRVALSSSTAALSTTSSNKSGPYLPTTFPVIPGRVYLLHIDLALEAPAATEAFIEVRLAQGNTVAVTDPSIGNIGMDVENFINFPTNQSFCIPWTPSGTTTGLWTAGLWLFKPGGTAGANVSISANNYNMLAIEEIG